MREQVEVRSVEEHERLEWRRSASRTFLHGQRVDAASVASRARVWDRQRLLGAYDGDRVVGTYRSWEEQVPVPGDGATLEATLVSSVTVAPTHRRRGLLTRMITADLRSARERGVALALLIAGEAPIYGRFGFGPAGSTQTLVVRTPAELEHRPAGTDAVTVELCEHADLRAEAPAVHAAAVARRPGLVSRDDAWWDDALGIDPLPDDPKAATPALLARDADGRAVGFARYRTHGRWAHMRHDNEVEVDDLCASTPAAHAALWEHLLSVDVVDSVRVTNRPLDDPLPEMLRDRRRALASEGSDVTWARLLDVPAALAARGWLGPPGACVLEVHDALGLAGGRWRVDLDGSAPGRLAATPTDAAADVVLDVGALSAAYLGETSLVALHAAGRVAGERAAVARLAAQLAWTPDAWPTATIF
ncbi:GNAT family N-acetyltransferase [Quadrisphaera sp. INWT6]|uniref:GNAT family N-acetyltransferase n=1 Tax=Quadrisphaera sp. INWT6 TaxID=2596917 RepID=UPI0018921617|nr:GNAT family N-acetyltransferase [Quadrisphaera sp. INWT6]